MTSFRQSKMSDGGDATDDLLQHLAQIKEVFEKLDPSGAKGLSYQQFRDVLTKVL